MCARCDTVSDGALALSKILEPLIVAAVDTYMKRSRLIYPQKSELPVGLTRSEGKLFSILHAASPDPVTFEVIYYQMEGTYSNMATLKQSIHKMRKKLPEYTITHVPSIGYRITWDHS